MRAFYIFAAVIVILLALSPLVLLRGQDVTHYQKMTFTDAEGNSHKAVVGYTTYGARVKSIDPATAGDTTSAGMQGYIYEGLYDYDFLKRPAAKYLKPQLADAMPTVSEDHLTYIIPIRKGVNYRRSPAFGLSDDGTPKTREVKAQDFELAFKRIADFHITTQLSLALIEDKIVGLDKYRSQTKGFHKGDFRRYDLEFEGVKALDDHTLQIKLTQPFPQFIYVLAMNNFAPIPREVIDYYLASRPGKDGSREPTPLAQRSCEIHDKEAAIGTGAYYLAEWIEASKIVMVRNPDFRREYYPTEGEEASEEYVGDEAAGLLADAGKLVPFVDVWYMTFVEESQPMWMRFIKKRVDSAGIPQEMYSSVITPGKELTDKFAKDGVVLHKSTYPAIYWFAFNMDDKVFKASKSLRQALNLSINVNEYIEVLYNGRAIRAVNYVPVGFEGHEEAGPSPYSREDLDEARKKIAQARKELVAAGVMKNEGDPLPELTLDLGGTDDQSRRMADIAQRSFRRVGVTLKINYNDWPTLQMKVHNKQTQIYSMGWHADYPDSENFLQNYYGPNIERGTNNTNYSNAEFDRLYDEAVRIVPSTPEAQKRRQDLYIKMIRILNEDCPTVLLTEPISFSLTWKWVKNVKPHPIGYGYAKYRNIDVELRREMGGP